MQGGALCALFHPSAKATFTILFCFFLFPLYIITKAKFVYFVTITSLPQTEMHLNNPCESAAKVTLRVSWQGMLLEACSHNTFPGMLRLVLTLCLSALAHLGTRPPTWMVAFGFSKQGSGKEALWLVDPIHGLDPSRHHHPPETVYLFHVLYWPHGKSCK